MEADDGLLQLLTGEGVLSEVASSGAMGIAMAHAKRYDVILLDLRLPDLFGLTVLERLTREVRTPVVVLTGYYFEPELRSEALRRGAAAFLHKPVIDVEDLAATLRSVVPVHSRLSPEVVHAFGIVAVSPSMQVVIDSIRRVAPTEVSVLLSGETGTGKELVARALHGASARRKGPFVAVNCSAIPEALVESELFGHRKGAFTGATADKQGLVEAADGGTLFLDEIGEISLLVQPRLLRWLDCGEVRRVGETSTRRVDVRVIAATNRDLRQEAENGRFRRDLYYRLCAAHFHLPPLRERPADTEVLVSDWLPSISSVARASITGISPAALVILQGHSWPGNARELRHVIERAVFSASGPLLSASDVREAIDDATVGPSDPDPKTSSSRASLSAEDRRLLAVLEEHRWNRAKAARALGINRTTLWRLLRRLDIR